MKKVHYYTKIKLSYFKWVNIMRILMFICKFSMSNPCRWNFYFVWFNVLHYICVNKIQCLARDISVLGQCDTVLGQSSQFFVHCLMNSDRINDLWLWTILIKIQYLKYFLELSINMQVAWFLRPNLLVIISFNDSNAGEINSCGAITNYFGTY